MPRLIKDRAIVEDAWSLLRDAAGLPDVPAGGPVIVPLALWREHKVALAARGSIGVWLGAADDPETLRDDLAALPIIAVDFPQFTDGRGYSTGRLLREKLGYTGELRAIGDVLRDQLYYLHACGFNAFALRADRDLDAALTAFMDFSDNYQSTVGQPLPLFRRRGASLAVKSSP